MLLLASTARASVIHLKRPLRRDVVLLPVRRDNNVALEHGAPLLDLRRDVVLRVSRLRLVDDLDPLRLAR